MHAASPELTELLQHLRRHGLRMTGERRALFEEIFRQHRHIDAEGLLGSLQERGVKISRATVYRNLDLLVECGLVRRHRLGRSSVYEHVHDGQDHDHLVCARCGRVVEFLSRAVSAMLAEICRAHDFSPGRTRLQVQGLCRQCAATDSQQSPGAEEAPVH